MQVLSPKPIIRAIRTFDELYDAANPVCLSEIVDPIVLPSWDLFPPTIANGSLCALPNACLDSQYMQEERYVAAALAIKTPYGNAVIVRYTKPNYEYLYGYYTAALMKHLLASGLFIRDQLERPSGTTIYRICKFWNCNL